MWETGGNREFWIGSGRVGEERNCMTLPDGSCVGGRRAALDPCLHDPIEDGIDVERDAQMQTLGKRDRGPISFWQIVVAIFFVAAGILIGVAVFEERNSEPGPSELATFFCRELQAGGVSESALIAWVETEHADIAGETMQQVYDKCPELMEGAGR